MIQDEIKRYLAIREDYAWHPDIMDDDEDCVRKLKQVITTRLSPADRAIILLYADCQSYRKLGKRLGVSHASIRKEVLRIRKLIMKEYGNIR